MRAEKEHDRAEWKLGREWIGTMDRHGKDVNLWIFLKLMKFNGIEENGEPEKKWA